MRAYARHFENEGEFQAEIIQVARLMRLVTYHTHDSRRSDSGFPDLVIVGRTGVLFRELKTDTGKVTPDQEFFIAALKLAGQDAGVWRPTQWPDQIIAELKALGGVTIPRPVKRPRRVPQQRSRR